MKKFFVTIGLILGLTTGISAGGYKNVVITDTAASIIKSLRLSKNFTSKRINGQTTYALLYDDISSEFVYIANAEVVEISNTELRNNLKAGIYMQLNSTIFDKDVYGICRSFTKSLAPDYPNNITSRNYSYRLVPNLNIKYGTIIASNASVSKSKRGHVAVLLYVGSKYIWVMDQNSFVKTKADKSRGIIEIHKNTFGTKVY
ncbi:MAG: hypothetical protein Q9M97_00850 [Candidatus Gracilibacteria bacterium]|nr:hypothetical protein [Candidatus Gracilibacteria bacterium]